MSIIGKRRETGQRQKLRESGVRRRDSTRAAAGDPSPASGGPASVAATEDAAPTQRGPEPSKEPGGAPPSRDAWMGEAAAIERLLDTTWQFLSRMAESPLRRDLCLVAERYRRAVRDWSTLMPTPVQRVILLDCVKALHDRVVSRSRRHPPTK